MNLYVKYSLGRKGPPLGHDKILRDTILHWLSEKGADGHFVMTSAVSATGQARNGSPVSIVSIDGDGLGELVVHPAKGPTMRVWLKPPGRIEERAAFFTRLAGHPEAGRHETPPVEADDVQAQPAPPAAEQEVDPVEFPKKTLLNIYDLLNAFVMDGPVLSKHQILVFMREAGITKPDSNSDASARGFERLKYRMRKLGIPFTMESPADGASIVLRDARVHLTRISAMIDARGPSKQSQKEAEEEPEKDEPSKEDPSPPPLPSPPKATQPPAADPSMITVVGTPEIRIPVVIHANGQLIHAWLSFNSVADAIRAASVLPFADIQKRETT